MNINTITTDDLRGMEGKVFRRFLLFVRFRRLCFFYLLPDRGPVLRLPFGITMWRKKSRNRAQLKNVRHSRIWMPAPMRKQRREMTSPPHRENSTYPAGRRQSTGSRPGCHNKTPAYPDSGSVPHVPGTPGYLRRSGASIFGRAEGWCKEDGKPLEFDSEKAAQDYADEVIIRCLHILIVAAFLTSQVHPVICAQHGDHARIVAVDRRADSHQ